MKKSLTEGETWQKSWHTEPESADKDAGEEARVCKEEGPQLFDQKTEKRTGGLVAGRPLPRILSAEARKKSRDTKAL